MPEDETPESGDRPGEDEEEEEEKRETDPKEPTHVDPGGGGERDGDPETAAAVVASGEVEDEATSPQNRRASSHWTVVFLCFYGFMASIKPGEPFITPNLLSPEKNFTREEVTNEISPVLSYSYMAVQVPIFLLTDYLRYKPVLILQSLSQVAVWLLLLLGSSMLEMQFMEFFYGITMASRVAYSSYIFSLVKPELYQRAAGYSRSALLIGVFSSSVLGQLCMSLGNVRHTTLSAVSLGFVSFGLFLSLCLPWPKRSLFFNRKHRKEMAAAATKASQAELDKIKPSEDGPPPLSAISSPTSPTALCSSASWGRDSVLFQMLGEVKHVVKSPSLRLWCLWWIFNSTGYYLVLFYVHILWNKVYPATENKHVYNGGVEAASTLLGAISSFAAGYVKIRWNIWSELVICIITALQAGLLLLMGSTGNIWVCYVSYALFRGFYQFLVPIAIFQIASSLTKELCALVFGINTFLGTILKSIITVIVVDKRGLALDVHTQFLVYFVYFALLTAIYLVCAVVVIVRHYRNQPKGGGQPAGDQATPTELSPVPINSEAEPLSNGQSTKD